MTNSKIALSIASIVVASALVIGATFAFFSDSGTSSGNVFATGTLDLQLSNDNETFSDSVTATFGDTNMAPGDCSGNQTLTLKNNGTINAGSVSIAASNTDGTLAPYLRINALTYDGNTQSVGDPNTNGWSDLSDFATSGLSSLPGINASATKDLVMDVCLDQSAPNSVQGLSNTLTLTVTLNQ